MPFKTEQLLFEQAIASPEMKNIVDASEYPTYAYVELKGLFGIPDLVVANAEHNCETLKIFRSFAFEMKLSNWKRALIQAFRYRAFANLVYVVIDRHYSRPAIAHIDDFVRSNIGLISIDQDGSTNIHHTPTFDTPYSYELEAKFHKIIFRGDNKNNENIQEFMIWNSGCRSSVKVH